MTHSYVANCQLVCIDTERFSGSYFVCRDKMSHNLRILNPHLAALIIPAIATYIWLAIYHMLTQSTDIHIASYTTHACISHVSANWGDCNYSESHWQSLGFTVGINKSSQILKLGGNQNSNHITCAVFSDSYIAIYNYVHAYACVHMYTQGSLNLVL